MHPARPGVYRQEEEATLNHLYFTHLLHPSSCLYEPDNQTLANVLEGFVMEPHKRDSIGMGLPGFDVLASLTQQTFTPLNLVKPVLYNKNTDNLGLMAWCSSIIQEFR